MTEPSSEFRVRILLFAETRNEAPDTAHALGRRMHALKVAARRTSLGKPYIPGTGCFGYSDCNRMQGYFFSNKKYVGMDLEDSQRPDLRVRQRSLHAMVSRIDLASADFLPLWVAKESSAKAIGIGMRDGLKKLTLLEPSRPLGDSESVFHLGYAGQRMESRVRVLGKHLMAISYLSRYGVPDIRCSLYT